MKYPISRPLILSLVLLLLMGCGESVKAMSSPTPPALPVLTKILPPQWQWHLDKDQLVFERDGDIWILFQNQINAPATRETTEQEQQRIQQHGQKSKSQFVFRVEPQWSPDKLTQAKTFNAQLQQQISQLPQKHGIEKRYNASLSRKGQATYEPTNDAEARQLQAYETEKAALEKKQVTLPDYTLESYSLFLIKKTGMSDQMQQVYPAAASREMYQIQTALESYKP